MPVEIRELIIRAVVNDARSGHGHGQEREPEHGRRRTDADDAAIIEECVRQVLKIIRKSGER